MVIVKHSDYGARRTWVPVPAPPLTVGPWTTPFASPVLRAVFQDEREQELGRQTAPIISPSPPSTEKSLVAAEGSLAIAPGRPVPGKVPGRGKGSEVHAQDGQQRGCQQGSRNRWPEGRVPRGTTLVFPDYPQSSEHNSPFIDKEIGPSIKSAPSQKPRLSLLTGSPQPSPPQWPMREVRNQNQLAPRPGWVGCCCPSMTL